MTEAPVTDEQTGHSNGPPRQQNAVAEQARRPPRQAGSVATVTDESLAAFLNLSSTEAALIIPRLTPERRAIYERMAEVVIDLNMGVTPPGVIVCRERGRRAADA